MSFRSPGVYAWGRKGGSFKSPINGALIAPAVCYPGVNAWARENVNDETRRLPLTISSWISNRSRALKSPPRVQVFKEISLVRLVPADLIGRHGADVQTIDVWRVN